ncbi:UNVERIFIED_CONTAM: ABC transporter ATP-binding protein [Halobacillus marinus]
MKMIFEVDHLSLTYDQHPQPVLKDINLNVAQGDSVLVLGPSGSGKSSLVHCLTGLYPEELDGTMTGTVKIAGKDACTYKPGEAAKKVGVVFQDPETQFCMLTVEEEVAFGLENLAVPPSQMQDLIEQALSWVGLEQYKKEKIHVLSGGQKQKLALACTLVMEPDVLILDEPTANLDPVSAREFIEILSEIKRKRKLTLVVIEHRLEGWLSLLTRVIVLEKDGHMFSEGPLLENLKTYGHTLMKEGVWLPYSARTAMALGWKGKLPLSIDEYVSLPIPLPAPEIKKPATEGTLLSANNVAWKEVLHNIHLDIHPEEWVAVVGANGSGKSSLSKLLAGIIKPSNGDVAFQGRSITRWKEKLLRREIGYVFQNPEHQFITDSVFEEVSYSLKEREMDEQETKEIVRKTLRLCQLEGLEHSHPFLLSQGQKRRLSVATMLVLDVNLLILDEPTFGQDAGSTESLMQILKEKHDQGTSIIMITHDMELVDRFATRTIVIQEGGIQWDGPTEELWEIESLEDYHLETPPRLQLTSSRDAKERTHVFS